MAVKAGSVVRGDVHLVRLDPTVGSEVRKTRPCLVVSPDELNEHLRTVIVAPMTTGGYAYPWRVPCRFRTVRGSSPLIKCVPSTATASQAAGSVVVWHDHHGFGNVAGNVRGMTSRRLTGKWSHEPGRFERTREERGGLDRGWQVTDVQAEMHTKTRVNRLCTRRLAVSY